VGAGRSGAGRALRGGSWNSNSRNVRCANRNANDPANRNDNIGFRCARIHQGPDGPAEQIRIPHIPPSGRMAKSKWRPAC
jgi:hypothetical protein